MLGLIIRSQPEELVVGSGAACARGATGKVYCWTVSDVRADSPPTPLVAFGAQWRHLTFWGQQLCAFAPLAPPQCARASVPAPREAPLDDDRSLPYPPDPMPPSWTSPAPALPGGVARAVSRLTADGRVKGCALAAKGSLSCFGPNYSGDVGDGTTRSRRDLRQVALENVVDVALGTTHSCAALASGRVACWGSNLTGQLGSALLGPRECSVAEPGRIVDLDLAEQGCVAHDDGCVYCWGKSVSGEAGALSFFVEPPLKITAPVPFARVSAGDGFSCAWGADGVPSCWGANLRGELGDGTRVGRVAPAPIRDLKTVVAMAGQCALTASGSVACWGGRRSAGRAAGDRRRAHLPKLATAAGRSASLGGFRSPSAVGFGRAVARVRVLRVRASILPPPRDRTCAGAGAGTRRRGRANVGLRGGPGRRGLVLGHGGPQRSPPPDTIVAGRHQICAACPLGVRCYGAWSHSPRPVLVPDAIVARSQ